jgi:L-gulonate 3-dehydrogenase
MSSIEAHSADEEQNSAADGQTITIAGAGSIGVAFSVLFALAGYQVRVWDAFSQTFRRAQDDFDARMSLMSDFGLLKEAAHVVRDRVSYHERLDDAVADAVLVQECIPEQLKLKQALFMQLASLATGGTVLASSTSALTPTALGEGTGAQDRIIVGHPGNPPYLLPVIEVVPTEFTSPTVTQRASEIYAQAGLKPVLVRREVEGFVFNRLQGALLREAYCLVRDGVASVEDIDDLVRLGLGRRWSVIGPFETADLNTRGGIASHAEKMGPAYERMGAERGQHDPWSKELVEDVTRQRRALLSLDDWAARVRWRDEQLLRALASDNS